MYINKVISYRNSWDLVSRKYSLEMSEALDSISDYINGNVEISDGGEHERSPRNRDLWEKALYDRGWEIVERTHYSSDGRRIHLGSMGPVKNGLSAQIPFGHLEYLSRWLFQQTALAVRHGLIKMPILFIPVRDFARTSDDRWISRSSFEMYQSQLELLSPLSHQYPFLIIGYSDQSILGEPEVLELEVDELAEAGNKVVDRCIEFPPEYHQAGLDILNYFGTYLREQYPEEETKVRIEQDGLKVRLVIETESGQSEIVEKALHEYELIVTGEQPPEKFTKNDKLILELRNELRIAQFRLESQQDLIGMQNQRIDKLLNIVGEGLSNKQPITIDFNPIISNQNTITLNQDISSAIGNISELLSELPPSSEAALALNELEGSLEGLETNTNPDEVRKAPAMNKFKRILDKILEEGSEINNGIKKVESGIECAKDLAKKYNKIAEWCGLPVVPSVLL
ncbi:hypothetical protein ACX03_10985 [Vibrio parahaemolyticus]|nr:hypothetical protein ACX03_10985 [Vibrio parahaemolyticus]